MDRRAFGKHFFSLVAALATPNPLHAKTAFGDQKAFMEELQKKPWLLGFLGAKDAEFHSDVSVSFGKVPHNLEGLFLRNGPAMHSLGIDRFRHWFDAPGMIQKFSFVGGRVTHHARMVDTSRNVSELESKRILFPSFGTNSESLQSRGNPDSQNVGNINIVEHAGELLALWEGGSPHVINPHNLKTMKRKTWSRDTTGMPFGAHPRIDIDGSLWNIGYSVNPAALVLYHISKDGQLLNAHLLPRSQATMVHDFMITESKVVIVLPPFSAESASSEFSSFVEAFEWDQSAPGELLVFEKSDLNNFTSLEIDAFWVFHFGNAYDINSFEIGFDFALHNDPGFMTRDAFSIMDGTWEGFPI